MTKAEFLDHTMPHQGIIYKVVNIYAEYKEDKEDLLQEIWLQLWLSFPRFKFQSKVSTWMYQVALNTALTHIRKSATRDKHFKVVASMQHIDDNSERAEQERLLWDMIRSLKQAEKALILLYIEGISYREIAEITGESEGNVGVKLNRIKQKMKKDLITSAKIQQ
ncbi:RNA polymerase sigma-70 factor, ECF subfamily [Chitinophaga sp. YR573]|uniref:RNA polymerase sigma factor n=1 Tax=Chitinophaga sp. YR573 TaxID=1881040 RepID=UPI0008C0DF18|nr:sigma-70 family RNA polymerase sigma factor [Chitinophaga sp. YR573]SEV92609.1 RNA polymerase sigma-70 factor, ECF subfamily [Chitinophaga sp. YR573]